MGCSSKHCDWLNPLGTKVFQSFFTALLDCCQRSTSVPDKWSLSFTFVVPMKTKGPFSGVYWDSSLGPAVFRPVFRIKSLARALLQASYAENQTHTVNFLTPPNGYVFSSTCCPNSASLCFSSCSWNEHFPLLPSTVPSDLDGNSMKLHWQNCVLFLTVRITYSSFLVFGWNIFSSLLPHYTSWQSWPTCVMVFSSICGVTGLWTSGLKEAWSSA